MRSTIVSTVALVSLTLLGASACGSEVADDSATAPETSPGAPASSSPPTEPSAVATPGRPLEILYPKGAELAVVGVAHDQVLTVYAGPSTQFDVVTTLEPTSVGAVATGRGWRAQGQAWVEVTTGQGTGWGALGSLAPRDGTHDVTAQVVRSLGDRPSAPNMTDLGRIVAESLASTEPASPIVMSVAPTTGDLGEVTFDVVGLADDSIWAQRLHVFGRPDDGGFSLDSVEATYFCARGTPTGDLCP